MSFSLPPQKPIQSGFAVVKYEQDAKGAAFPTGAYIDVRDQGKTQARQSIAMYFTGKKMRPVHCCTGRHKPRYHLYSQGENALPSFSLSRAKRGDDYSSFPVAAPKRNGNPSPNSYLSAYGYDLCKTEYERSQLVHCLFQNIDILYLFITALSNVFEYKNQ